MKVQTIGSVLCFNFADETLSTLDILCRRLGIRLKPIAEEDFSKTVGALAGIEVPFIPGLSGPAPDEAAADGTNGTKDASTGSTFTGELMVLFNLNGSAMDQFLAAMRKNNIYVPYKCVLTPTNMNWKPADLFVELSKEHEAMKNASQNASK